MAGEDDGDRVGGEHRRIGGKGGIKGWKLERWWCLSLLGSLGRGMLGRGHSLGSSITGVSLKEA